MDFIEFLIFFSLRPAQVNINFTGPTGEVSKAETTRDNDMDEEAYALQSVNTKYHMAKLSRKSLDMIVLVREIRIIGVS